MSVINPVILSGGAGTRLWPLSRQNKPKQFHSFGQAGSLFAETARRFSAQSSLVSFAPPITVCNESQLSAARAALSEAGIAPGAFLLEPIGRNTAPAAIAAAIFAAQSNPDALLLVTPSDHLVTEPEKLISGIKDAALAARDGKIVTFGIQPSGPETGYGYIRCGAKAAMGENVFAIDAFAEKPALERARSMLAEGGWLWNAGMFLFSAKSMLAEARTHAPQILEKAQEAVTLGARAGDVLRLGASAFEAAPSAPLDVAIMEKTESGAVVPVAPGWSDIGSWSALWDIAQKDAAGNSGGGVFIDSNNCLVQTDGPEVALLGVSDLIVVVADGAVMVLPRRDAQRVRDVVEAMKAKKRADLL